MKFEMLKIALSSLLTIFFLTEVKGQASINSGQVNCDPPIVGQKLATLTVQFLTDINIPISSFLQITVPVQSSVKTGFITCGIAGYNDADGLKCTGLDSKTLEFQLLHSLNAFESNVFKFENAFNAPLSTEPSDTFIIKILNKDKSLLLAQSNSAVSLSTLQPNILSSVSIAQSVANSTVVGASTQIVFTVTTLNPIPPGGGLKVDLPKWNTQAAESNRNSYIIQSVGQPLCLSGKAMEQINCLLIVTPLTDTLVVKDMFPKGRLAGDTFQFIINQVRNPLSMSPVQLTVTTYSQILSEVGGYVSFKGLIDQGTASFFATLPAPIDPASALINADDTTVFEPSQFIIPFRIPVPVQLELGCTVLITLPDDFIVISGQLTIFRGWGIFQGVSELHAQVNEQQRTIKIVDQCVKYTAANQQNTIRIGTLRNPGLVKPTKDFKIQIQDKNGLLIASVETGITYTPTYGTINQISLVPHSATIEIQENTDVELVFTPDHPISGSGKLHIKMPNDLPAKCDITASSGGIKFPLTCQLADDGTIVLMDPFSISPYYGDQRLSITFRRLTLPNSQRPILGITIQTYDMSGGAYYLIDQYSNPTYEFFKPKSVTFLFSSIETTSTSDTFTFTEYQFRFRSTCATQIPVGSVMQIYVPKQVTVLSDISVMSSCNSILNLSNKLVCSIQANDSDDQRSKDYGSHTITVRSAFDVAREKGDDLILTIKRGLLSPISTETSDSFKIFIFDKNGYEINFVNSTMTLTMQNGRQIETIEVVPDSFVVGATSKHNITFTTPVPFNTGFKLQIFVPQEIITPRAADIVCLGVQPLIQNIKCQLNGNRVTLELETLSKVNQETSISIIIGPLVNPGSTLTTQKPYQLSIRSDSWYEVAEVSDHPGGKVQMKDPSQIKNYNFEVYDLRQKALTTVTINWVSTQTYPKDTKIVIDYDQSQISPQIANFNGTVPCIFRQSRLIKCTFEFNKIFVSDIMPSDEYGNSNMQLTITNMFINVLVPLTTTSWVLTTYLNDGLSKIDRISEGMSLTFKCNYPCQTCQAGLPDVCTSCNTIEGDQILYNSKCYMMCPTGTFFQYFQCKLCDQKCKTCQYTSGTSCTSCNPDSKYPFLNGKDCSASCNYQEFGNRTSAKCESCQYPCEQCTESPNKCTSCRQDSLDKYYFNNQCLAECPQGQYVQLEARNNICLPCSSNCLTCQLTSNTCTSCPNGFILNHLDNTCVKQCPNDLTVFTPKNATQPYDSCEPCKSSCKTCKGDINTCTSCRPPLSLRRDQGKCVLECDVFQQSSVSVNGVCQGCSSSCLKCQQSPDYCIKCVNGTYFYQNHCVLKCPMIDDYQFEPNEEGTCVIPGLICPFGYKVTYEGTGCELKNQVCEEDYELNHDKTACVPVSRFYVPFPMFIVMILLQIIPIVSKVKFRASLIVPNFIVFISFMETICIIVLVAQAKRYGIIPTFYLAVVGLVFQFASNMFFMLMYVQQVKPDSAFKHWFPKYSRSATTIQILGIFNFKMYRLLYSKLFGRDEFNAPFTEPTLFYRPFNLTSLFALVTVSLPVIVSSIIGLIYVRWGYQLYITCIEMLILSVTLLILQVVEYCQQNFVQKQYFKVTKKQVEVKVCSDFPDSDESDEYGTRRDKSKSKPKSIKAVRHLGRVVARMAGNEDFAGEQIKQVEKEIEELHVEDMMHRQLRHCQSFKLFRPTTDEAFSGDEGDDADKFQDFISEPASPRSKEMLFNRKFVGRMHYLHDVYKMRDQFDNCYHEAVDHLPNVLLNPIEKRVQTNVLELLGIDDVRVSPDLETDEDEQYDSGANRNNRRKRLSKKRMTEIPEFEFDEIQGEFEADDNGRFLLIQKLGRLHDKNGRLVNRRGYLIDQIGNVINKLSKVIFYADELSPEDDELPDPYCYEKIKALKSQKHEVQFRVALHTQVIEDKTKLKIQNQMIEQEFEQNRLKKLSEKLSSKVEPFGVDDNSSINDSVPAAQETYVHDEEEKFIQNLTQLKQPKSKNELISAQERKAQSQASQQRLKGVASVENLKNNPSQPIFKAMRPPSQTSVHRVEQLQEIIQMKDLIFTGTKQGQGFKFPQTNRANQGQLNKYIPGQDIAKVYKENENRLQNQRHKVLLDQEFLGKMESFNKQLNSKRKEFLNNSQGGRYLNSDNVASEIANQMESRGLAHRNLHSVYGRVKQKFNQNVGLIRDSNFNGPSATINKKVDSRMQQLEEIYLHPRIDGKEIKPPKGPDSMQTIIESLEVTKQLRDIHHIKSVNQSVMQSQFSVQDAKSQNWMRDKQSFI